MASLKPLADAISPIHKNVLIWLPIPQQVIVSLLMPDLGLQKPIKY